MGHSRVQGAAHTLRTLPRLPIASTARLRLVLTTPAVDPTSPTQVCLIALCIG